MNFNTNSLTLNDKRFTMAKRSYRMYTKSFYPFQNVPLVSSAFHSIFNRKYLSFMGHLLVKLIQCLLLSHNIKANGFFWGIVSCLRRGIVIQVTLQGEILMGSALIDLIITAVSTHVLSLVTNIRYFSMLFQSTKGQEWPGFFL